MTKISFVCVCFYLFFLQPLFGLSKFPFCRFPHQVASHNICVSIIIYHCGRVVLQYYEVVKCHMQIFDNDNTHVRIVSLSFSSLSSSRNNRFVRKYFLRRTHNCISQRVSEKYHWQSQKQNCSWRMSWSQCHCHPHTHHSPMFANISWKCKWLFKNHFQTIAKLWKSNESELRHNIK